MKQIDKEELITIAMNVILHAGNARDYVFKSIHKSAEGHEKEAEELLDKANEEIKIAHKTQTETIQKEAEGIEIPYSTLFSHAQDTLMTVKTEINLIQEINKIHKRLEV